jgi:hypothetical protein
MIPVQLKAKHFYFVANDLKRYSAEEFYTLIKRIAMQCGGMADDDLVTVNTTVYDLVKIFQIIANKSEGQANRINTEMMQLLTPQIQAGVAADEAEWIDAAQQITAIRESNWAITDAAIAAGKAFIQQG